MDNRLPSKLDGRVETVNVDGDEDWHHTPSSPYAVGWISHDRSSSHVLGLRLIRETFDHFQSAESAKSGGKRWKVRRSALLEVKCLLLEAKVALSARIGGGNHRERFGAHK